MPTKEAVAEKESITRMGLALYPADRRIAEELAERHHGGNIARLVRTLLRDAWKQESEKEEQAA
jgi:hypothetical protein